MPAPKQGSRGKRVVLIVLGLVCGGTLLLFGGCIARLWYYSDPAHQITVGPDTTVIDGPLTVDGFVDYEAALNQQLSADVTTDNNAVVLLVQAMGLGEMDPELRGRYCQRLGIASPSASGTYFIDMGEYVKELNPDPADLGERTQALFDAQAAAAKAPWTEADRPELAALLARNEGPLSMVVEASRRSRYYAPLVSFDHPVLLAAVLPIEQEERAAVRLLTARAMLKLGNGNAEGAWEDLLACHRLSRLTGQSWCLIGALVSVALDAVAAQSDEALLASPALTADQARQCLADLEGLSPLPSMADVIDVGERYVFLDCVRLVAHGQADALIGSGSGQPIAPSQGRSWQSAAVDWNTVMRVGNEHYDAVVAAMRISDPAVRDAELTRLTDELPKPDPAGIVLSGVSGFLGDREAAGTKTGDVLLAFVAPAINQTRNAETRAQAKHELLRIGFALAVYQRENREYPETLDALVPDILPSLPGDPNTLAPFIYRRTDSGYLLYSVGQNRIDDQGVTFDDQPPGDDVRIRVEGP